MFQHVIAVMLMSYQAALGLMGSAGLHAVMGVHHGCHQRTGSVSENRVAKSLRPKPCQGHCCHGHVSDQAKSEDEHRHPTPTDRHQSRPHQHDHCWLCDLWILMSAPASGDSQVALSLPPAGDARQWKCVVALPVMNAAHFIRGPPQLFV